MRGARLGRLAEPQEFFVESRVRRGAAFGFEYEGMLAGYAVLDGEAIVEFHFEDAEASPIRDGLRALVAHGATTILVQSFDQAMMSVAQVFGAGPQIRGRLYRDIVDMKSATLPDTVASQGVCADIAELADIPADKRRKKHKPRTLRPSQNDIRNLLRGLAGDTLAGGRIVRHANGGKKQPQIVVDLGRRRDRRAGVRAGRALLDGDCRRKPLNVIDVRLLHLVEKLAGVGREALDVFPLTLSEKRVKGQRRLSRSAQPGDHDELMPRDCDIKVLKVMLSSTLDPYK